MNVGLEESTPGEDFAGELSVSGTNGRSTVWPDTLPNEGTVCDC